MLHKTRLGTRLGLAAAAVSLGLVATTSPAATAALPDWGTAPSSYTNPQARMPRVVDLRWARHTHFDRVVIDINGRRPGYRARYVRKLVYDGSGRPVPLQGRKKFSLVLNPASAHNNRGESVYEGPRLRQVHLPTLRGIAFTGDFEGYVSFGFTTDRKAPYRIFTLTNPSRVVLDFKH